MIKPSAMLIQSRIKATMALPRDKYQYAFGESPKTEAVNPGRKLGKTTADNNVPAIIAAAPINKVCQFAIGLGESILLDTSVLIFNPVNSS
jgi:hypothetical protein